MSEVIVHGVWPSPFYYRVAWALRLKDIEYKYVEEDFPNKSPELLKYNPVHKKIPLLVHNGHPVCESMIIVEYIDQIWPVSPLLPSDPLQVAKARFWLKFLDDKSAVYGKLLFGPERDFEAVTEEIHQIQETIEEHLVGESKFLGGDEFGFLDIAYGTVAMWGEIFEEVAGVEKSIQSGNYPRLHKWFLNIKEHPVVRDTVPDHEKLLNFFKIRRQMLLSSS